MFGSIIVSDGISMGTEGLKFPLLPCEVMGRLYRLQRPIASTVYWPSAGATKNMPGARIAIARMNIPAIFVYSGTMKPGGHNGKLSIPHRWRQMKMPLRSVRFIPHGQK